ncbi:Isochorismatase-like protein [Bisporella sp. PMI_857]|nr:Isochorismatase-like protein [Bisporella sp. PMI_857]
MASDKVKVIGGSRNFWIWLEDHGFDLTHAPKPTSPPLATKRGHITVDPTETALVIVDMRTYFLSPLLGHPSNSAGLRVVDELLQHPIPACRKANISIDIDEIPPSIVRGFEPGTNFEGGEPKNSWGASCRSGHDARQMEYGIFPSPAEATTQQDIWIYKNGLSGFWRGTKIEEALKSRGIKTLLFAGENTDQCVSGSVQDAYMRGWDCLVLSDGCGTTSPEFATKCIEFNCEGGWGFVLACQQLAGGVENIQTAPDGWC